MNAGRTRAQKWPKQGEKETGGSRSKKKVATKKAEYGEDAVVGVSSGH